MKITGSLLLIATCLLVFQSVPAQAQSSTGSLSGQVTDPGGAIVPGVSITVTNVRTGIVRKAQTNEIGEYSVPLLPPSEYEVAAEKPGFRKFVRQGITLLMDQQSRQDIPLALGATQDSVTVTAAAEQFLKPTTSELGQVIEGKSLEDLPLNGRNFQNLIALNAGVSTGGPGQFQGLGGFSFNINGGRVDSNASLIDGMDNNLLTNQTPNIWPTVDAIDQFNIATNSYSAEYGRAAGGVVNVRIRSGTNSFHGSLFEYLRNDKLDASNFFTNSAGQTTQPYRFNIFGGSLGGPIKKDKAFFFVTYQGNRSVTDATNVLSVPPLAWRNGDFSSLLAQKVQIYDPTNVVGQNGAFPVRAPFAGNIIPASQQNPIMKTILSLYPAPNRPGNFLNYVTSLANTSTGNDVHAKFDYHLSDKDSFFVRHSFETFENVAGEAFGINGQGGPADGQPQNFGAGYTRIIRPTLLNEFRVGYVRRSDNQSVPGYGKNLDTQYGILGINNDPTTSGLASICFNGYNCLGGQSFFPIDQTIGSYQFLDNVSWIHGRHSIKTGVDYHIRKLNLFQMIYPRGYFFFDNLFTSQAFSGGNPIASALTGYAGLMERDVLGHYVQQSSYELGAFFQDDIRVSSRLTLNLGLRYDVFPPPVEGQNRQADFDLATRTMVVAGQNGASRRLVSTDWGDVGPRVGFAYALTGNQKTVLRGGYGISYFSEQNASGTLDRLAYNPPFYFFQIINQNGGFNPTRSMTDGLPAPSAPDPAHPFGKVDYRPPNQLDSYQQSFNLDIQRALLPNLLLDVAYAGGRGVHLLALRNLNQPPPGPVQIFPISSAIGNLNTMESDASSTYHSLQAKLTKRFSHGLSFLASYTFSKSIDDSIGYWAYNGNSTKPQDSADYGKAERALSIFDMRHRFVVSYSWDIPVGKGRQFLSDAHRLIDGILGGWQLSGITTAQSGTPFTPIISTNVANTANSGELRPNRLGSGELSGSARSVSHWFDPKAFALPSNFTYGNSGRNILIGPGLVDFDLSLVKNFRITERARVQLRGEFFNLFNHSSFGLPNRTIDVPTAGIITSTSDAPRQIQIALRLEF